MREVARDRDVAQVEAVAVRAGHQPREADEALVEEHAEALAARPYPTQGPWLGAHPTLDLLGLRGPQDGGAARRLQLGLVELIVAAHDGDHGLVVGDVHQRLQLLIGGDAVRLGGERIDGQDPGRRELLERRRLPGGLVLVGRLHPRFRLLGVRGVPAALAGGDQVLASVGGHHELRGTRTSHRSGVRFHLDGLERAAAENPDVRLPVILERLVEPLPRKVEGVAVLHGELAHAQEPALGPRLVAELGLDLVPDLRELAVAAHLRPGQHGEDLLVRHGEAQVRPFAVLEAEHVLAHHRPAPGLLPDLVHLLPHDLDDLEDRALAERQDRVDAGGELPDVAGAHQELVRGNDRVRRHLFQGRRERFRHSHEGVLFLG